MLRISLAVLSLSACVLPAGAQMFCDPLPAPAGTVVEVTEDQASSLRSMIESAAGGTTFLLHDGIYDLSCGDSDCRLVFGTPGITLRSYSGDREAVVLDGNYATNELISIYASNITIAGLTLMRAYDHPIHITGPGSPISNILIHNVHIIDPGQQAIKINPDASGLGVTNASTIECSFIELTDDGRTNIRNNCYTGGIDGHATTDLVVRRNRVEGFWCNDGLSEHGIHLWRACTDTIVEENLVLDCARGIGFGLGYGADNGHQGGIIRNNFVAASSSGLGSSPTGFDCGISLESAAGAEVYHNTVVSTFAPLSSSIEWRWDLTTAIIANNLTSHALLPRNDASATLNSNISSAALSWFVDPAAGDLHLASNSLSPVGAAALLTSGLADSDFDGELRGEDPDVGADEFGAPLFADDFESSNLDAWSVIQP